MRRSDFETIEVSAWGDQLASRIAGGQLDPDWVIHVLEPFATERRISRMKQVFRDRISAVTVVLDRIHDPHNGAAIMRTAEGLGLSRLHLVSHGAGYLAHAQVAQGSHKWVEVRSHRDASSCVSALRADGMRIVGTHPKGGLVPADLARIERVALVLGNEHDGISDELTSACDEMVRIPMSGFVESFNVSVGAGVLMAYATSGRAGDLSEVEQKRLYARGLAVTVPNAEALLERHAAT